ncbi:MAG: WYL domain-containing protein [Lachnospiraceae bacterium]|nr:WYL domain-containing protein [Lachnospiraceae bacterium]
MSDYQELIKNFDRIRDYMRQFFIYGWKSRSEYDSKSARTYDNERRRIESWLSGYIQSGYSQKGKQVYVSVDSKTIPQNPLYAAWKSKSFTDNDILLHFFLLDLLWDRPEGGAAGELCDAVSKEYGVVFDSQTVRLKLKEYEELGILAAKKEGKSLRYRLLPGPIQNGAADVPAEPEPLTEETWQQLLTAVTFFQEASPFGFVGSTILDRENKENIWFQFKHHFIVHTLEDGVLADVLSAMKAHRRISFENKSSRSGNLSIIRGIPLKIFVSTQTGRRYLCLYLEERRRFASFRLDSMSQVNELEVCGDYERKQQLLAKNQEKCWGVSFGGVYHLEEICMKIYIDEEKESHILNRLYREGRGGEVLKIREHEYLYSGAFFDTNEMLAWVKTFTGRILDIQGTNASAIAKVTRDWEKMYRMYCNGKD